MPGPSFASYAPPFGGFLGGGHPLVPPRAVPLPMPRTIIPQSYEAARIYGRAFAGLPEALQLGIAQEPTLVSFLRTRFPWRAGGEAGDDPSRGIAGAWTWFPRQASIQSDWGVVTPEQIARHELAHVGLGRQLRPEYELWMPPARRIRQAGEQDPRLKDLLEQRHAGTRYFFTPPGDPRSTADVVRSRREDPVGLWHALNEYLASLLEKTTEPRRMPIPLGLQGADPLRELSWLLTR